MQTLDEALHKPTEEEQLQETEREHAAIRIQKAWRKRMRKRYLGADFLWKDLAIHARMQVDRDAAGEGKNTSRDRWRRGIFLATRLQDGDDMLRKGEGSTHPDAARKHLETQHWLEFIDGKHRYGSNREYGSIICRSQLLNAANCRHPHAVKYYHDRWKHEDTKENFFRWLDRGGGKDISLKECPREQLEKERITYLSPSQRLNYLITIDSTGKLRWARNGELVDTTAGRYKDAGGGRGIVPFEAPDITHEPRASFSAPSPDTGPSSGSNSSLADSQMMHYVGLRRQPKNPVKRVLWKNFTLKGLVDKLLRKTIKRNTWIYVSDKNFNIYIGIKAPGTFQHSSFLAGGLVTSAGLISVKDGLIHTLSPLSGHYRTSIDHFRRFTSVLEERGVDMDKVQFSKAELALWGIEHITKFKKKQAALLKTAGKETTHVVRKTTLPGRRSNEHAHDKQETAEGKEPRPEEQRVESSDD
ncbi:hypothetical protein VTO73DRAFT_709 [Trametes versicolor]